MPYVWNQPHALDRMRERSSFTDPVEIERLLDEVRYVVKVCHFGDHQDHHLIWDKGGDEGKGCLLAVPVVPQSDGALWIPTILPVTYANGLGAWQRAEAERAWQGDSYWESHPHDSEVVDEVTVAIGRMWQDSAGYWRHRESFQLLVWPLRRELSARTGDESVVSLLRIRDFCTAVRDAVTNCRSDIDAQTDGYSPMVHLKKCGAHRWIPLRFFLNIP